MSDIRFAPEASGVMLAASAVCFISIACSIACARLGAPGAVWPCRAVWAAAAALYFLSAWFYRDPDREPASPDGWLSPADGRVVEIIEGATDDYAGRSTKIGIFMSGLDVHVNRFPAAGTVESARYVPGKKWFAIAPKASEENERFYVGIKTAEGRATLVQIAGILARRISMRVKPGDTRERGERYGMIKLGSKVDIYLPETLKPSVGIGDRVRAGETVIAR